ncbi:hypothetical protein HDE70_004060 [Pedobacter cryoconitis]|nr:hypothetical protein [Pedobacter cryoconitis]
MIIEIYYIIPSGGCLLFEKILDSKVIVSKLFDGM